MFVCICVNAVFLHKCLSTFSSSMLLRKLRELDSIKVVAPGTLASSASRCVITSAGQKGHPFTCAQT